ncbi:methyl-accepting chemotaxis protein [Thalassotalea atypica]|uniref:methyl-accepting chemotaxis protein n=1 Tax=Thalassotalea atypica TaxID=2054316 RepID=UPI002572E2C4|nr:methyl-accepting chemotaxis protein [Thalassotalea atypica]
MNFFKKLNIFTKILAILAIALLSFIVNLAINITAISENQILLKSVKDKAIHLVNVTSENVTLWNRVDEIYTQSVTFNDEDLIADANEVFQKFITNLKKIETLDGEFSDTEKAITASTYYNKLASEISVGLINETLDFTSAQGNITDKAEIFTGIEEQLIADKENAITLFNNLVESTIENSRESKNLSIIVGIFLLSLMSILSVVIASAISKSVTSIETSLKELSQGGGDLTNIIAVSSQDELGRVVKHFNSFTQLLRGIVKEVVNVVSPLTMSADELAEKVRQVDANVKKQTETAEVTKQSMIEMQQSVNDITKSAGEAATAASSAELEVNQGADNVQRSLTISGELTKEITVASGVINQLAQDSQNMNTILDVINGIADQTNLLALNAAIEAARAGEQGRGFAVVADEVRNLASRTSLSTTEIRELLDKLISAADLSVNSMNSAKDKADSNESISMDVNQSLSNIKEQIGHISSMNSQIATATEEQSFVVQTVVENIGEMYESFASTKVAVESIGCVAQQLDDNATHLKETSSKFII